MARDPNTRFGIGETLFGLRGRLFDLGLAVAVVAVVVMMIVPLTPWLLDLLISFNLGLSILVFSLGLFIRRPLAFTAFPTLLLVATLYRLALNVSSTRLILLRADAGHIIGGFGGFVVGGDILVGAVIFGILAMVLFLVITKGAERVAEVAARFTLDALPGMQMAIDADMRAGAVSPHEASRLRMKLDNQSRYYGALDGAMKFVRGDALAGLIIIGVNIVGGIAVGMLRHGMSIGQALDTYGRLTVGDGLVTMIPALLISTAAGLLVTRVGQGDTQTRLGEQIGSQLSAEPRALGAAAAFMLVLAFVPAFPIWPFLLVGAVLGFASFVQFSREKKQSLMQNHAEESLLEPLRGEAPAVIEMGRSIYGELSPRAREQGGWGEVAKRLSEPLRDALGLPVGQVPVANPPTRIDDREVRLRIRGVIAGQMVVPLESAFGLASKEQLAGVGVTPLSEVGSKGAWISDRDASLVRAADMEVLDIMHGIIFQSEKWLRQRAGQLVGIDETGAMVDRVARSRPVLVRETVPKLIGLPALAQLLSHLVSEGISLDYLSEVLEVLSRATIGKDPYNLLEQVRRGLAPLITANLLNGRPGVSVLVFDAEGESVLISSLTATANGQRILLPADVLDQLVKACRQAVGDTHGSVLLVKSQLRRPLRDILSIELPEIEVVAHGEIESNVPVEIEGTIAV